MIYETSAKKSLVHGIEWALGMLFRNTIGYKQINLNYSSYYCHMVWGNNYLKQA